MQREGGFAHACVGSRAVRMRLEGVSEAGSWQNGKKGIRLCKDDFMFDLKLQ
jgi:hypothetical protein